MARNFLGMIAVATPWLGSSTHTPIDRLTTAREYGSQVIDEEKVISRA